MKQGELLARISAQLRVKADATWVQSIVKGVLEDDSEAMNILQTILPEPIISRIQVCTALLHTACLVFHVDKDLSTLHIQCTWFRLATDQNGWRQLTVPVHR